MNDSYFAQKQAAKERRERYYRSIMFPITGALALIDAAEAELKHTGKRDINLATAFRTPEAVWSLYSHLGGELTKKQQHQIERLLRYLEIKLKELQDDPRHTDGWDEAMRYYNTSA